MHTDAQRTWLYWPPSHTKGPPCLPPPPFPTLQTHQRMIYCSYARKLGDSNNSRSRACCLSPLCFVLSPPQTIYTSQPLCHYLFPPLCSPPLLIRRPQLWRLSLVSLHSKPHSGESLTRRRTTKKVSSTLLLPPPPPLACRLTTDGAEVLRRCYGYSKAKPARVLVVVVGGDSGCLVLQQRR